MAQRPPFAFAPLLVCVTSLSCSLPTTHLSITAMLPLCCCLPFFSAAEGRRHRGFQFSKTELKDQKPRYSIVTHPPTQPHPHLQGAPSMLHATGLALRRRLPFSASSSSSSGGSSRAALRWLLPPALPPSLPSTTTTAAGFATASSSNPFHKDKTSKPSGQKEEERAAAGGAAAAEGEKESLRHRLKHAPIDPRLYQHLERLGLGSESTTRHKKLKRQQKKRKLTMEELRGIDAQITRDSIPYFQAVSWRRGRREGGRGGEGGAVTLIKARTTYQWRSKGGHTQTLNHYIHIPTYPSPSPLPPSLPPSQNRFRQCKRAVRKEKRRLIRELANKEHLRRRFPSAASSAATATAAAAAEGGHVRGAPTPPPSLPPPLPPQAHYQHARLFRAQSSSSTRFATASFHFDDLPPPLPLAVNPSLPPSLPPALVPEIALAGRSNVGKSTLLNALLSLPPAKRGAAAVGDKPGVRREGEREGGREGGEGGREEWLCV